MMISIGCSPVCHLDQWNGRAPRHCPCSFFLSVFFCICFVFVSSLNWSSSEMGHRRRYADCENSFIGKLTQKCEASAKKKKKRNLQPNMDRSIYRAPPEPRRRRRRKQEEEEEEDVERGRSCRRRARRASFWVDSGWFSGFERTKKERGSIFCRSFRVSSSRDFAADAGRPSTSSSSWRRRLCGFPWRRRQRRKLVHRRQIGRASCRERV